MHIPVLLNEIVENLDPKPGQKFIDATVNGGGHAFAVLEKIAPDGKLLGIEWDHKIARNLVAKAQNEEPGKRLTVVNDSYVNIGKIAVENGFDGADGILFDLGLSTWQLDAGERGFSFLKDEPLDMRFSIEDTFETAADIVNKYQENDLADLIYKYGEERYSRRIAAEIVRERKQKRFETTFQLVEAIKRAVPFRARLGRIHYATRTFQALRITVNHELENVETGVKEAIRILKTGGKIAIISFHSLEDRIIKNLFKDLDKSDVVKIITKKPITAGLEEKHRNYNSRSAKLRVAEKLSERLNQEIN